MAPGRSELNKLIMGEIEAAKAKKEVKEIAIKLLSIEAGEWNPEPGKWRYKEQYLKLLGDAAKKGVD